MMRTIVPTTRGNALLSKRRLAWAGAAAVAGCTVVCAVPLLAAVGIGGGVLAGVAAFVKPGTEIAVGAGTFLSVLGTAVFVARKKRARGGAGAILSVSCSCDEPIACTFDMKDMGAARAHIDGYRAAFEHLVDAERFAGGFRWMFRNAPGLEHRLKKLAEREHDCCRFMDFELFYRGNNIVWETRADDRAASVMEAYFRLPETLRVGDGGDVAALQDGFVKAGLQFPSA
jgi:hypothetical protein